jgi:hypothetical protein
MTSSRRTRLRHGLFAIYVVVCLTMICWPGYAWLGNSIDPYVLGLPFSLAWVVGWVLMTFLTLVVFHLTAERSDDGTPGG